jgi:hypothetical protein
VTRQLLDLYQRRAQELTRAAVRSA